MDILAWDQVVNSAFNEHNGLKLESLLNLYQKAIFSSLNSTSNVKNIDRASLI